MSQKHLTGSIELTKLKQKLIVNKRNKAGEIIRCLLLPIEGNGLLDHADPKTGEFTNRVFMDVGVLVRDEQDEYGQNGFISKRANSELYKEIKDDEEELKSQQPILGNIKDWSNQNQSSADVMDDDDDIPF